VISISLWMDLKRAVYVSNFDQTATAQGEQRDSRDVSGHTKGVPCRKQTSSGNTPKRRSFPLRAPKPKMRGTVCLILRRRGHKRG
jgi:hypothetical protein